MNLEFASKMSVDTFTPEVADLGKGLNIAKIAV